MTGQAREEEDEHFTQISCDNAHICMHEHAHTYSHAHHQTRTTLNTGGSETLFCQTTSMTTSAPLPQIARVGRNWEWSVWVMNRVPTGEPFLLNNATDMLTSNTSTSTPTTSPANTSILT